MSPLFVVGIPLALTILGIALNSFHIVHDQPQFSSDQDAADKLAAERQAHDRFFRLQRARMLQRQKRVGQYGWLVFAVFIASSWWLYSDAVKITAMSKQVSAMQTLAVANSKDTVLSLTLSDGSNVQYVVKAPIALKAKASRTVERGQEGMQQWELANLTTAFNIGDTRLPLGIALKMSN